MPKRMYLMEDALTGLHSQKATGISGIGQQDTGVNYYMGMSIPSLADRQWRRKQHAGIL